MNEDSRIYLDFQATTPVDKRVLNEMLPYFTEIFGNPHSSDHIWGWKANEAVEKARGLVAGLIGSDTDEIFFTSGATESNNIGILGIGRSLLENRRVVLISSIEHKSVLNPTDCLNKEGLLVETIPVDHVGNIDIECLEKRLSRSDVGLMSIMAVNNEIGSIQDIKALSNLAHKHGAYFHTDAAQSFASINIDVYDSEIDALSVSGHKIYGPKGIGVLFVKRELQSMIKPIMFGGGQESGIRPGTVPVPICVGIGKAAELIKSQWNEDYERIKGLRDHFYDELKKLVPDVELIGPSFESRHIGNLNIYFPEVDAHQLIAMMQPVIAASTGSACTSGITNPSHVLAAIGLPKDKAQCCVRFSLGRFTTQENIDFATEHIVTIYEQAKKNKP